MLLLFIRFFRRVRWCSSAPATSTDFLTAAVRQTVQGDLTGWSNLVFTFTEEDLAGFDPTDLIDLWIYLDRELENFPGNELYIDYIAIGGRPDTTGNSPCGLPDLISGTNEAPWAGDLSVYPNPTGGMLTVEPPVGAAQPTGLTRVYSTLSDGRSAVRTAPVLAIVWSLTSAGFRRGYTSCRLPIRWGDVLCDGLFGGNK